MYHGNKGFTLLELLLVIAIIAVLSSIIVYTLRPSKIIQDSKNTETNSKANDLEKAIQIYTLTNQGSLPPDIPQLESEEYYDICKLGQATGEVNECVNLDVLTNSDINIIPIINDYETAVDSGYKLKYEPNNSLIEVFSRIEYEQEVALSWDNILHLGVIGGKYDYKAVTGINGYHSHVMHHNLPLSVAEHTCILKRTGNVDCWGRNDDGQAEDYIGGDAIGIGTNQLHTCILKSDGNVDCYGQSGVSFTDDYIGGDAIGVALAQIHTCILLNNGNVHCYGENNQGGAVDYTGGDAIAVSAGQMHTCVLKSDGNVDCYGYNDKGQAADYNGGDAIDIKTGLDYSCALRSNGNVICWGDNFFGKAAAYTGGDAIAIATGFTFSCILKSNGNVDCRGLSAYAGEATDYNGRDAIAVEANYFNSCILKANRRVDCRGDNSYNQVVDYNNEDLMNPFK